MKRLLILIIIVAIGAGFWYFNNQGTDTPLDIKETGTSTEGKPDPMNGTYTFDNGEDGTYTLNFKNGSATRTIKEGSIEATFETEITVYRAYGDLNKDGKEDVAVIIGETSGLSAVPIYVASFVSGPIRYKGSNAIFIGDRVQPEGIEIKNGVITVNYLDRKEDEPLAAEPTVPTSKEFIFQGGLLIEK